MTNKMRFSLTAISIVGALQAGEVEAGTPPTGQLEAAVPLRVDVEVDPIAYALRGYSLHAGFSRGRFRVDLGAFAIEIPEAIHKAEGLEVFGSGFGVKLDYRPIDAVRGFFVGTQLTRLREDVTASAGGETRSRWLTTVGARVGYRWTLGRGFYVLPWIGVDWSLTRRRETVAGIDYDPGRAMFLPTVHVGRQF
jgi:hypothetical protein